MARKTKTQAAAAAAPVKPRMTIERITATKTNFFDELERRLKGAETACAYWLKCAAKENKLCYSLHTAHGIAPYAATTKVVGRILAWVKKDFEAWRAANLLPDETPVAAWHASTSCDLVLETMHKEALREALRGARHPTMSTSPSANMMERAYVSEWAHLEDMLSTLDSILTTQRKMLAEQDQANA